MLAQLLAALLHTNYITWDTLQSQKYVDTWTKYEDTKNIIIERVTPKPRPVICSCNSLHSSSQVPTDVGWSGRAHSWCSTSSQRCLMRLRPFELFGMQKNISWWSWLFVGTRKGLPQNVETKLETHNCLKYQRMLQLDDLSWSDKIMCPHTFGHIMYFESYMKLFSLKQKVSTLVSEQRW